MIEAKRLHLMHIVRPKYEAELGASFAFPMMIFLVCWHRFVDVRVR